jgi:uncharacterized cupin superfamily protein
MEIVNEDDLDWTTTEHGDDRWRRKQLGAASERIGTSLYELPPGSRSWPYHYHTGNEEAIYVLDGTGLLRHDGGADGTADTTDRDDTDRPTHRLEPGDYAALPAGPEGGHRIVNDGEKALRYLAVSTMDEPDVTVYPDSGKVGVFAGAAPGGDSAERTVSAYFRRSDAVDYWDGE